VRRLRGGLREESRPTLIVAEDDGRRASGAIRYAPERPAYAADLSRVRDQLDPSTFVAPWAEGNAMNADRAVDYALELLSEPYAGRATDR
jgi:hypothetical protein